MNIDFKKGIINGIIIYVVVFMAISVLIAFNIDAVGTIGQIVGYLSSVAAAYYLATKIEFKDVTAAFGYGAVTALVGVALDLLITMRFNPAVNPFSVNMLIGYVLIILAPMIALKMKK